jgi:hypothetical protein
MNQSEAVDPVVDVFVVHKSLDTRARNELMAAMKTPAAATTIEMVCTSTMINHLNENVVGSEIEEFKRRKLIINIK